MLKDVLKDLLYKVKRNTTEPLIKIIIIVSICHTFIFNAFLLNNMIADFLSLFLVILWHFPLNAPFNVN